MDWYFFHFATMESPQFGFLIHNRFTISEQKSLVVLGSIYTGTQLLFQIFAWTTSGLSRALRAPVDIRFFAISNSIIEGPTVHNAKEISKGSKYCKRSSRGHVLNKCSLWMDSKFVAKLSIIAANGIKLTRDRCTQLLWTLHRNTLEGAHTCGLHIIYDNNVDSSGGLLLLSSASFLAETLSGHPEIYLFSLSNNIFSGSKYPKKHFILFWTQKRWSCHVVGCVLITYYFCTNMPAAGLVGAYIDSLTVRAVLPFALTTLGFMYRNNV